MMWLTADCVIPSCSAALVNDPVSTTLDKVSYLDMFILLHSMNFFHVDMKIIKHNNNIPYFFENARLYGDFPSCGGKNQQL